MFNNSVLDVTIGLVFIFLLYSLLATAVQEAISTVLHRRANTLYDGIKSMLSNTRKDQGILGNLFSYLFNGVWTDLRTMARKFINGKKDTTLSNLFYEHPIIKNYGQNLLFKKPSYLTSENFSSILIEILKEVEEIRPPATQQVAHEKAQRALPASSATLCDILQYKLESGNYPIEAETRKILQYHLHEAAGDLNVFKFRIERWYNDTMDRVSGWYKRNTQFYLLLIGFVLAAGFNIDTIAITNFLSDNKVPREQLARLGQAAAGNPVFNNVDSGIVKESRDSIKASIGKVNTIVGLGWGDYGLSDTAYRRYRLKDTESKMYNTFITYKDAAAKTFSKDSSTKYAAALKDTANTGNTSAIRRDSIISEIQFGLLYKNEDFGNDLKRGYVYREVSNWKKLFGLLITALAISMGAPFWFDLLNKVVSIRTAVKTVNSSGSTTKNNSADNNEIDG